MYLDAAYYRDFYLGRLGRVVRRLISRRIRARWPDVGGETVMGLGFAPPYLGVYAGEAERLGALMPAAQGVVAWPEEPPYRAALVDEYDLPLGDSTVERLLLVHALEMSEAPQELLREAWRVLAPGGSLIAVVPNRRGLWARVDTTPFGHGRPFSRGQLADLLKEGMYSPLGWEGALAMPPSSRRYLLRSAPALERIGAVLLPGFEGVWIVEATKEVYAPVPVRRLRRPALRPVLAPPASGAMPKSGIGPPAVAR
ncbi:MAG: methyltransferase domain-containing protein [Hyphomicrobiales bacterium]|nr:methyltransferase domain-containing protein [Hyphomicrobiales bacterium]